VQTNDARVWQSVNIRGQSVDRLLISTRATDNGCNNALVIVVLPRTVKTPAEHVVVGTDSTPSVKNVQLSPEQTVRETLEVSVYSTMELVDGLCNAEPSKKCRRTLAPHSTRAIPGVCVCVCVCVCV